MHIIISIVRVFVYTFVAFAKILETTNENTFYRNKKVNRKQNILALTQPVEYIQNVMYTHDITS